MPEIAFLFYENMTALDDVPGSLLLGAFEAAEDDPDPPFDSGSPDKADAETQRRATEHMVPGGETVEVAG